MKNKKLRIIRKKLDVIDNKLLNLFKQRTNLVKEILKNKKNKKEIVDKKRIKEVLKNIKSKSKNKRIDAKVTRRIWKSIIASYIEFEKRNYNKYHK